MATIKDVAIHAAVSTTTVSHTINGTRFVDPATQERVWTAVRELRYRPNNIARGLRRRETHTIGLIIPDNANPYFADLARAIEDSGYGQGYSVILCNSDRSAEKEASYVEVLLSRQIDGLMLVSTGGDAEAIRQVLLAGVPVVMVPGDLIDVPVDIVMSDEATAGRLAAQYLLDLGHTQIGCISGPRETSASAGRVIAFRKQLADSGVVLLPEATVRGDFRAESGRDCMSDLLQRQLGLSAVFAANDAMAIGALSAIWSAGLHVPNDISVIGFDGIWLGAVSSPPLTTIAASIAETARIAVEFLRDRMRDPGAPPRRVLLPPTLLERESCAPPRGLTIALKGSKERRTPSPARPEM